MDAFGERIENLIKQLGITKQNLLKSSLYLNLISQKS